MTLSCSTASGERCTMRMYRPKGRASPLPSTPSPSPMYVTSEVMPSAARPKAPCSDMTPSPCPRETYVTVLPRARTCACMTAGCSRLGDTLVVASHRSYRMHGHEASCQRHINVPRCKAHRQVDGQSALKLEFTPRAPDPNLPLHQVVGG